MYQTLEKDTSISVMQID